MSEPLGSEELGAGVRWAFNGAAASTSAPILSHLPDCAPRAQKAGELDTPNLPETFGDQVILTVTVGHISRLGNIKVLAGGANRDTQDPRDKLAYVQAGGPAHRSPLLRAQVTLVLQHPTDRLGLSPRGPTLVLTVLSRRGQAWAPRGPRARSGVGAGGCSLLRRCDPGRRQLRASRSQTFQRRRWAAAAKGEGAGAGAARGGGGR